MTLARTVIADTKCVGSYSIADHVVGPRVGRDQADAILAALAEAGFELIDTKVTRPDWKSVARDMIGIHDLMRRRSYFNAAETLEPGYTKEAANEQ